MLVAIEWILNEVSDNVLVHAGGAPGWVQVVAEPRAHRVELTVVDRGLGIFETLRHRYPQLRNSVDAIRFAIEPAVTRDVNIGQGNGLSGSVKLSRAAGGFLNIASRDGQLRIHADGKEDLGNVPGYQGTIVSMTLPTSVNIDVEEALWGHRPTSHLELAHVGSHGIEFDLAEQSSAGYRSRSAGAALANRLRNVMAEYPNDRVVIDFAAVPVISASFADEFLGKLAAAEGVTALLGRVNLVNTSSFVRRTVDAVIAQRLSVSSND